VAAPQPPGGAGGQSRRVIFIDLARALATVFMLYGHTVAALLAPQYQQGTWFEIWVFQRGLTSCLFLLLSGFAFSIATSKYWASHGTFSPALLRRTRRFVLFILLGYALHFPAAGLADLATVPDDRWRSFLAVDVLQLIGVTFLVVQLLLLAVRSRTRFTYALLTIAVAIVALTPTIWDVDAGAPVWVSAFLSPAIGSQFPLFPWAAYILTGGALGQFYVTFGAGDLVRYSNTALVRPGAALAIAAIATRLVDDTLWAAVPTQVALRMGASLLVLALVARASRRIQRLPHVFSAVAQESLLIYFVHLCIVYGSNWNRGLAQVFGPTLTPSQLLIPVVLLMTAMAGLAGFWNALKHTHPPAARWISIGAGGLLLYRLL
jgi:uncharacterized membrane protein